MIVKKPEFLDEYLLNKFIHSPRLGKFYLNFSDISFNVVSYIEKEFFEYIMVNYEDIKSLEFDYLTLLHFNMLEKEHIPVYTFIFRDRLLELLKDRVRLIKENYKMDLRLKSALESNNIDTTKIDSPYTEYISKKLFSISNKNVINFNRHYGLINLIRSDFINLNNSLLHMGLPTFTLRPTYKKDYKYINGKKIPADYFSFRIYNDLALTKNDIEKGADYYKNSEDRMRSDWICDFTEQHEGFTTVDLGDMTSNFPNLLYCLKNGVYPDKDFHSEIAEKYGISRKIAKLASVACCFNQTKKQVLYHIIKDADDESKELFMKSGMVSEKTGLLKNRAVYVDMFHEWLKNNNINEYIKNSLDMLTSWEACSKEYANDLCNADLCAFSSVVELRVVIEAFKKGFIIYNAYDHGYCFNGEYDWKGEYKKWAEIYAVEFNKLKYLDEIGHRNCHDYQLINLHSYANSLNGKIGGKIGDRAKKSLGGKKLGKRNAAKDDVFNYVIKYGIDAAQKKYGWDANHKAYWNRKLKKYNAN